MNEFIIYYILILLLFTTCKEHKAEPAKEIVNADTIEYLIVWQDEFDYSGLPDSSKWSYDTQGNSWNWGNNELQNYTANNTDNAYVKDGILHIVAIRKNWENNDYTSARLISKNKGDWLYAKIEVRAKLSGGKGLWPAIWMLPTDWEYGDWPKSGEIDIMEHVGYMPDSVFASIHTETYNHTINTQKTKGKFLSDCENKFHIYSMEWTKKEILIFVDSVQYFSFSNQNGNYKIWPFDKRFHLLLNVAVGGNWGGLMGVDTLAFPQEMLIDYVRVYQ